MKVTYCSNQMDAAIHYILTNNPHAENWSYQDIRKNIMRSIKILATEDCCMTGTAGYTVVAEDHDTESDTLYVSILVDPSLGTELEFETLWVE